MFFDAVIASTGVVLFNGTPEETKKFIIENKRVLNDDCNVYRGSDLRNFSLTEYVNL